MGTDITLEAGGLVGGKELKAGVQLSRKKTKEPKRHSSCSPLPLTPTMPWLALHPSLILEAFMKTHFIFF